MGNILIAYVITGLMNYAGFFLLNLYIRRIFIFKQYLIDFFIVFLFWPLFPLFWEKMYVHLFKSVLKK